MLSTVLCSCKLSEEMLLCSRSSIGQRKKDRPAVTNTQISRKSFTRHSQGHKLSYHLAQQLDWSSLNSVVVHLVDLQLKAVSVGLGVHLIPSSF